MFSCYLYRLEIIHWCFFHFSTDVCLLFIFYYFIIIVSVKDKIKIDNCMTMNRILWRYLPSKQLCSWQCKEALWRFPGTHSQTSLTKHRAAKFLWISCHTASLTPPGLTNRAPVAWLQARPSLTCGSWSVSLTEPCTQQRFSHSVTQRGGVLSPRTACSQHYTPLVYSSMQPPRKD